MIRNVHALHLGVEKCKHLARDALFWQGITSHIEDIVLNCQVYSTYHQNNAKELMVMQLHDSIMPMGPSMCQPFLFSIEKTISFWLTGYYSGLIELNLLHTTTTQQVITYLKLQFFCHGIQVLLIDNDPQFASNTFKQFTKEYCSQHSTSSTHYPQSNSMDEKAIQMVKTSLRRQT